MLELQQTENLRLQLKDALQRESNLKKINDSLMEALLRQPNELLDINNELHGLNLKHLDQLSGVKAAFQQRQQQLLRQINSHKQNHNQLSEQVIERETVLKILSLKIHQSQLTNRDLQSAVRQLQGVVTSQKTLIENAKSNMDKHLLLKQNLESTDKLQVQTQITAKLNKIIRQHESRRAIESGGLRSTIQVLQARIKLLQKQKQYQLKVVSNLQKSLYI